MTRDSAATRELILGAVTSLLATRGPEFATVRKVAAEAGLSPGAVQHHFRTRDDLIAAAYGHTAELFRAALEATVAGIDSPAERFRAACHLLAGCADDSARTREATAAWLAFAGIAATGGPAAPGYRDAWQQVEDNLAAAVGDAEEAALLLAMLDGIAVARLTEPGRMPAQRGRALIDRQLARLAAEADYAAGTPRGR
ncbi:TetR/AcrR family transcriptional regulator [Corynebacterium sp. NPDC060344]|uniref:TetR/AcrR family transcriptional regulator n=1 Tax=Corynebacterium sp. NPDC060344 TaxID=3347101 RepID=UPI00365AFAAE